MCFLPKKVGYEKNAYKYVNMYKTGAYYPLLPGR